MKPGNISDQARAKLIWGEPAHVVREFLTSNGLSDVEADGKIAEWSAERNADIRRIGVKKLLIGAVLTGASIAYFYFGYRDGSLGSNYRSAKAHAITALVGIYGSWKLMDGIIYLVRPQSEKKSITEIAE